jgi:hypothetical protein
LWLLRSVALLRFSSASVSSAVMRQRRCAACAACVHARTQHATEGGCRHAAPGCLQHAWRCSSRLPSLLPLLQRSGWRCT